MQDDVLMTNPESSESQEFTTLPLLALRDVVVYPQMQIALFVGRTPSVKAVELAQNEFDNKVLVVAQKDSLSEDIDASNLFEYGTVCRVVNTMPHENDENCIKVLIEGLYRAKLVDIQDTDEEEAVLLADFEKAPITVNMTAKTQKSHKEALVALFSKYAENRLRNSRELIRVAERITQLEELVYFIATRVSLNLSIKQNFLEVDDLTAHIKALSDYLIQQSAEHNIEQELQEAVRRQMENNQREYFLNEKMKAIKSELSDLHEERGENYEDDDIAELEKR